MSTLNTQNYIEKTHVYLVVLELKAITEECYLSQFKTAQRHLLIF